MSRDAWVKLEGMERLTVGHLVCDAWAVEGGARYAVFSTRSTQLVRNGRCRDLTWAKEVSAGFACSVVETEAHLRLQAQALVGAI